MQEAAARHVCLLCASLCMFLPAADWNLSRLVMLRWEPRLICTGWTHHVSNSPLCEWCKNKTYWQSKCMVIKSSILKIIWFNTWYRLSTQFGVDPIHLVVFFVLYNIYIYITWAPSKQNYITKSCFSRLQIFSKRSTAVTLLFIWCLQYREAKDYLCSS